MEIDYCHEINIWDNKRVFVPYIKMNQLCEKFEKKQQK